MVALNDSNLVPSFPSRAHPRVQGSMFATKHQTVHQGPFLLRSVSHFQALQGKSTSSPKRLHRVDHSNQQYSILAISNTSGAVVERVAYQAYGQPTFTNAAGTTLSSSAKATRYSYTGREWDPSLDLHHFRERWVSGVSGRFLGRDSLKYLIEFNLYVWAESNPVDSVDPDGAMPRKTVIVSQVPNSNPAPDLSSPPIMFANSFRETKGNCGQVNWTVGFYADRSQRRADISDAHVVQEITIVVQVLKCDGTVKFSSSGHYWEAWPATEYANDPQKVGYKYIGGDSFILDDKGNCTKGTASWTANFGIFAGPIPPEYVEHGAEPHTPQPATFVDPQPRWGARYPHNMSIEWDCCGCDCDSKK